MYTVQTFWGTTMYRSWSFSFPYPVLYIVTYRLSYKHHNEMVSTGFSHFYIIEVTLKSELFFTFLYHSSNLPPLFVPLKDQKVYHYQEVKTALSFTSVGYVLPKSWRTFRWDTSHLLQPCLEELLHLRLHLPICGPVPWYLVATPKPPFDIKALIHISFKSQCGTGEGEEYSLKKVGPFYSWGFHLPTFPPKGLTANGGETYHSPALCQSSYYPGLVLGWHCG